MEDVKGLAKGCLLVVFVVALIVGLSVGGMALNGQLYPWWLSIQRNAVEQSKSFTDANNIMLQKYIQEYSALETKIAEAGSDQKLIDAYRAQEKAIINLMCREKSTMAKGTIDPDTLRWLNSHGGCE